MIGSLFRRFLDEHEIAATKPFSKNAHTEIITSELPELISDTINAEDKYKIYGSCGKGQWAETPWVAILNRAITESTQNGYYVCYLIDPKQKIVYLCLAVGWTQFYERYPGAEARNKIEQYSNFLVDRLHNVPASFKRGHIDLSATGSFSKGYEVGQILSKAYSYSDLEHDESLISDLQAMIKLYYALSLVAGDNILNVDYTVITGHSELTDIDKIINAATLQSDTGKSILELVSMAEMEPPSRRKVILNKIIRNRKNSTFVKNRAHYVCEICGRPLFIQKNGEPYAEADHTEALGKNGVDHPDNMRCLCAQCHAVVTHGSEIEQAKLLTMAKS